MKNDKVPLTLRLDSTVYEALKLIAVNDMRSVNMQIEYIIRNFIFSYKDNMPNEIGTKFINMQKQILRNQINLDVETD